MKSPTKRTTATIASYTALTLILTAGAAQSLSGSNTVFSDDIVDGTIVTADLKAGSVSGSRILDNSVTGTDLNESTLINVPGGIRFINVVVTNGTVDGGETAEILASCSEGTALLSGGAFAQNTALRLVSSYRQEGTNTWRVRYANPTASDNLPFQAQANCAMVNGLGD